MTKFAALAAVATVAFAAAPSVVFAETTQAVREVTEEATAPAELAAGKMLYSSTGYRVAPIYRVKEDGNPQVIVNGRLVTVPASSIATVDGKFTTTLTKKEIASAQ